MGTTSAGVGNYFILSVTFGPGTADNLKMNYYGHNSPI